MLLLLAACASEPQIESHVTRFHMPELVWQGKSFVMQPTKKQAASLEMQRYQQEIVTALTELGMKPLSAPPADLGVRYDFAVGSPKTTLVDSGIRGYGWDFGYRYGGFGGPGMEWGLGGPMAPWPMDSTEIESFTTYPRIFSLQMVDLRRKDRPTRFESKVVNEGSRPSIVAVSRCLIQAALHQFPGEDGETIAFSQPSNTCMRDAHAPETNH